MKTFRQWLNKKKPHEYEIRNTTPLYPDAGNKGYGVFHKETNKQVGEAEVEFDHNGNGMINGIQIHKDHARKGLATMIHDHVRKELGDKKLIGPTSTLSVDAQHFWLKYQKHSGIDPNWSNIVSNNKKMGREIIPNVLNKKGKINV